MLVCASWDNNVMLADNDALTHPPSTQICLGNCIRPERPHTHDDDLAACAPKDPSPEVLGMSEELCDKDMQ